MHPRLLLVIGGLALFGAAVIEMLVPGSLPLPIGEGARYLVGAVLLVYAYFVLEASDSAPNTEAETPDVEISVPTAAPGTDFQVALDQFLESDPRFSVSRTRSALRAAATAVLTRYGGFTESDARRRIDDGRWTTNPTAAAFLGVIERPPESLLGRFRGYVRPPSRYRRDLHQTVEAIAAIAGFPPSAGDGPMPARGRGLSSDASNPSQRATSTPREIDPSESTTQIAARRATNHWTGISLIALVGIGVGLLVQQPAVLLAGVVGIGYAAYARWSPLRSVQLSVVRSLSDDAPEPGTDIEVTVSITNDGPHLVPDLRVVDGVPEAVAVTAGSPRCGTSLRAGASTSFSYTIRARRGRHEFNPLLVMVRNLPTTVEQEMYLPAAGDSTLTCTPSLRSTPVAIPLRHQAIQYAGMESTGIGGDGLEFYTTREYQPGDALNRVDWHRVARTGEIAAIEFRQERAARVVIAIDVQPSAYAAPAPEAAHAVDRSVEAASDMFARLLADGHHVGIATLGPADCWLGPAIGSNHRFRGQLVLGTDPALSPVPQGPKVPPFRSMDRLRRRLQPNTQVVVLSPLTDVLTVQAIQQLDASGHPVTVVSPDVTADRTPGQRLMQLRRTVSITDLRRAGIPAIDWPADRTLESVLANRHGRRAS